MHPAAKTEFLVVEAGEVVLGRVLHGVVIGEICLQDNGSGGRAASSASSHLG